MQRARTFFYVCAGLFLLVLGYHFGASSATAQAGAQLDMATVERVNHEAIAVAGRTPYVASFDVSGSLTNHRTLPEIPGSATVVGVGIVSGSGIMDLDFVAVLSDGSAYGMPEGGSWRLLGSMTGLTPAAQQTWGSVKTRYLPGAAAAPGR
jgi:hypothetical protein